MEPFPDLKVECEDFLVNLNLERLQIVPHIRSSWLKVIEVPSENPSHAVHLEVAEALMQRSLEGSQDASQRPRLIDFLTRCK